VAWTKTSSDDQDNSNLTPGDEETDSEAADIYDDYDSDSYSGDET